ncbi:MAG: phosphoribosyl-AMP cyclohydrolase [Verrucomicrobia bacterium]|nr:phosphoribosyl-AMP cyclohydrolase [Verrucomicrobiota bacterium]
MFTESDSTVELLRDKLRTAARTDKNAVEKDLVFAPKFDGNGLITAVTVDAESGEVLMVACMNEESLAQTLALGEAVYFSRSRQKLWHKGATSGHTQEVVEIRTDCDQDALVLRIRQKGPGCCHAGYGSCFYRSVPLAAEQAGDALVLQQIAEATYNPDEVY